MSDANASGPIYTTRMIVRTYEVDGFLHVNNAIFAQYFEAARGDLIRALGLGYAKFHDWSAAPVVTHLVIDYVAAARADDELVIALTLAELKRTLFTIEYDVRRASDDSPIVTGLTRHAFTDPEGRVVRVPNEFRVAVERLQKARNPQ